MKANIGTIPKNSLEEIRVGLDEWKGRDLVNIRVWAEPYEGGERRPTKKGLAVAVTKLPALVEALQKAEAAARDAGLLGAEGQVTRRSETAPTPNL